MSSNKVKFNAIDYIKNKTGIQNGNLRQAIIAEYWNSPDDEPLGPVKKESCDRLLTLANDYISFLKRMVKSDDLNNLTLQDFFNWHDNYNRSKKTKKVTSKIPSGDPEAAMEAGENTTTFAEAEVVVTKAPKSTEAPATTAPISYTSSSSTATLAEQWNTVNDATTSIINSANAQVAAMQAKKQAIMNGVTGVSSAGLNVLGSAVTSGFAIPQIAAELTQTIISETTSYVASSTAKIAAAAVAYTAKFPVDIAKKEISYFNHLVSVRADVPNLKDILMSQEYKNIIDDQVKQLKEKEDAINKKTEMLNDATEEIQDNVADITDKLNNITEHIQEGPSWAQEQCEKLLFNKLSYIGEVRDKAIQGIAKFYQDKSDKIAHSKAQKQYAEYIQDIKDNIDEQVQVLNATKMKAQIIAAKAQAVAISKIAALVGL